MFFRVFLELHIVKLSQINQKTFENDSKMHLVVNTYYHTIDLRTLLFNSTKKSEISQNFIRKKLKRDPKIPKIENKFLEFFF